MLAFHVARRSAEIGVRIAQVSTARHLLEMMVGRGLALVGLGLVMARPDPSPRRA